VLVKFSSITSFDSFNLSSAGLNKPEGPIFAETPFSAISRSQLELIKDTLMKNNHCPTPTYRVRHLILISSDSNL
jgi:hypothetical protein